MPAAAHVLPDGSEWAWTVEWARTSESSLSAYDVAEYDTDVYDGSGEDLDWQDASGFTLDLSTRSGKDRFLKRYRTSFFGRRDSSSDTMNFADLSHG